MSINSTRAARRAARRAAVALAATGALAVAPSVAHADTVPLSILTPGSTICVKAAALSGAHTGGTASNQGAAFSVFRNGVVLYFTGPNSSGFTADFVGGGIYKICATNNNSTNTKITLTLQPF
jgi:hypothetical protein